MTIIGDYLLGAANNLTWLTCRRCRDCHASDSDFIVPVSRRHFNSTHILVANMPKKKEGTKGKAIRFCGGTYCGESGWIDDSGNKNGTAERVAVIVGEDEKVTHVNSENVDEPFDENTPNSYAEAVIMQHSKLERDMTKLCKDLARCRVDFKDSTGPDMVRFFEAKLKRAAKFQARLGKKAVWKDVEYEPDESDNDDDGLQY